MKRRFGVSPAYFLSKFGTDFTPDNFISELVPLRIMGFSSVQLELTNQDSYARWTTDKVKELNAALNKNEIVVSQLVGHLFIECFESHGKLIEEFPIESGKEVIFLCSEIVGDKILTLPFPPVRDAVITDNLLQDRLKHNLNQLLKVAQEKGVRLAFELQPHNIFNTPEGFINFINKLDCPAYYNLDTGHVNASGICPSKIIDCFEDLIIGTHLCDNNGITNSSDCPGTGNINWVNVLRKLEKFDDLSLDLEIFCPPEKIKKEYERGLSLLMKGGL